MKHIIGTSSLCALALASFSVLSQTPKTPSDLTCAAALSVPPTSGASNLDFDRMQQYFQALVNIKLSPSVAAPKVSAEANIIAKKTLEERMSISRQCGMRYINENPNAFFAPKRT